jgi:hypothetical protein
MGDPRSIFDSICGGDHPYITRSALPGWSPGTGASPRMSSARAQVSWSSDAVVIWSSDAVAKPPAAPALGKTRSDGCGTLGAGQDHDQLPESAKGAHRRRQCETADVVCAPSAIRTRGLLLRSNPRPDAVATSDGAGHASGGRHCCSPSYLVIATGDTGPTTATEDTAWTVPQAVASSRRTVLGPSATSRGPAGSHGAASPRSLSRVSPAARRALSSRQRIRWK